MLLISRNTIEVLTGIVVLAEVRNPSCAIKGFKVRAVKIAREIFCNTSAERRTRIDRKLEQPYRIIGSLHRHFNKIGTLVLQAEQTNAAQVRRMCPLSQVLGGVESEGEVDGVCENHDPALSGCVPDDFGISELSGVGRDDWVVFVGFESVSIVPAVGDGLLLWSLHAAWVLCKRIDGYDSVVLIGEESRCVVGVDHRGSGKDEGEVVRCPQGDLLVLPVIEII